MFVLDSSGMLAVLLNEERGRDVRPRLSDAVIGAVNLAEVAAVLNRRGFDAEQAIVAIDALRVPVLPASTGLAIDAGMLEAVTRSAGLSLGDRFALALARQLSSTLVTSDRRLADMAGYLDVQRWLIVTPGAGSAR